MKLDDIKNMEATYLDYKESLETTKPVSWLKSVVAFANTKGGHIIFGGNCQIFCVNRSFS